MADFAITYRQVDLCWKVLNQKIEISKEILKADEGVKDVLFMYNSSVMKSMIFVEKFKSRNAIGAKHS